jgi:hypothetical protein
MPLLAAPSRWIPAAARYGTVLWLSFLLAAAATGVFFSAIDPDELRLCVNLPPLSRSGAYTVGFFLFWLFGAISGVLAVAFTYPAAPASQSADEILHRDD